MPPIKGWKKTGKTSSQEVWMHRETKEYVRIDKENGNWWFTHTFTRKRIRFDNRTDVRDKAVSYMRSRPEGSNPGIARDYIKDYFDENTMRAEKQDMIRDTSLTERDLDKLSDQGYVSYTRFSGKDWVMWVY